MALKVPPAVVHAVAGPVMRLLARSWRRRVAEEAHWDAARRSGRPLVLLCWHEALLPLLWHHRGQGITLLVSEARDGQYLVDFAARLGYRAVRGSSTRGGARALLGAVRELRAGRVVAVTPDGPRGPRRVVKPGALLAAQRSGALVVPLHARARWAWRLDSWDRFLIPRPGARVEVRYAPPFGVEPGPSGVERAVGAAEAALKRLAERDD